MKKVVQHTQELVYLLAKNMYIYIYRYVCMHGKIRVPNSLNGSDAVTGYDIT